MSGWRETEYGNVPSHWRVLPLADISGKITDGAHLSPKPQSIGKYMCSVKDMTYNKFDLKGSKLISNEDYEKLVKQGCQPKKGDILISKDGANCLDLIFIFNQSEELVLLSSIAIVRLLPDFIPEYVRYFLLSPDCQYIMRNNYVSGSAIPRVVLKDFKKVPILIPPIEEQKSIASVLSSLDDKIDLLHRQNKTLEAMAETLFRQWFVEGVGEAKPVLLGDYVDVFNGVSYKSDDLKPSKTAMVTLKSFDRNGGFRLDGFKEFIGKYKPEHVVEQGDLVVAHTDITQDAAVIGNPVLVVADPAYEKLVISMDLVKVKSRFDWLTNEFLYVLMRTGDFKQHCLGYSNGSTVLHLSKKAIPSYEFNLPSMEKAQEFSLLAKNLFSKKFKNIEQVRSLEKLRDGLLPKLMSGEVRVA